MPRYSSRALPAYRFIPGEAPHPTRDPRGHSFGFSPELLTAWRPEEWRELEGWLWAVDLFNAEYWWESHEALESFWHAAGRTSAPARFVQALVHLSAACLNRRRGHSSAAKRQAARAIRGLQEAPTADGKFMGIDLDELIEDIGRSFASDRTLPIRIRLDAAEAGREENA